MSLFSERLKSRMKELGLRQIDIVNSTNASKGAVSGWIKGEVNPNIQFIEPLAKVLKTTPSWLLSGDSNSRLDNNIDLDSIASVNYAPVLSWVQAGNWTDMETINITECEMLPLVPGAGKRSFYLEIKGLSNAPYFEEGEKICIDPDHTLSDIQNGEMVVVKCGTEATFKALIVESNGYYLRPLNPNWVDQIIPLKDGCELVGKYVGSFKPAKKFNFLT